MSQSKKLRIGVLGSTGSVGTQTLDIVRRNPEAFEVVFLSAQRSVELLSAQIAEFKPSRVGIVDAQAAASLQIATDVEVLSGPRACSELVRISNFDAVVVGIIGFAALEPVLMAIRREAHIALANKEVLVAASSLVQAEMLTSSSVLIPVDSEHNGIFQCLMGRSKSDMSSVTLTASGGPFLSLSSEELASVSPAQAARHPNWEMGNKISIDSATLMNKGLEVIEAAALFDLDSDRIHVLVHPQSIVHAIVEFTEGTSIAALYHPDMRVPITFALDYLRQVVQGESKVSLSGAQPLNLAASSSLEFYHPDLERFPCLALAYQALRAGGTAPTVLNAANEVAVEAFCQQKIGFLDISSIVAKCLSRIEAQDVNFVQEIIKADSLARSYASEEVETFKALA